MQYKEVNKVEENIKTAIKDIEGHNVDSFVNENYQQYLVYGEHSDNTLDTSYYFNTLKSIENNNDFMRKMRFILRHFT